jgi:transketolase
MKALRDAFAQTLSQILTTVSGEQLRLIDCDVGLHSRLSQVEMMAGPQRYIQAGIAEQHAISLAGGYAKAGKRPVVASFAAFITTRAFEQCKNTLALQQLPVVIYGSHAGFAAGEDGASHQSYEDVALMQLLPGFQIFTPGDATEMMLALKIALQLPFPSYIRAGRAALPFWPEPHADLRPRVLHKGGQKVILSCGEISHQVLQSLQHPVLAESYSLVHCARLSQLQTLGTLLQSLHANAIIAIHDNYKWSGFPAVIQRCFMEDAIPLTLQEIGVPMRAGETGSDEQIRQLMGLDALSLSRRLLDLASH